MNAGPPPAAGSGEDVEVDVLVVGAGQAGLGVGYWLGRRTGLSHLLVDAAPRLGQSWLDRWDSLELFTPRRFSSLPGLRFRKGTGAYPSKDQTAAYLTDYARQHDLPVRLSTRVVRLSRDAPGFVAQTTNGTVRARHVVVASGPFSGPYVPQAGAGLDPAVSQLHASQYRRPADVPTPDVLVVGGGNSAAQLAVELAQTHRVTLASPGPLWFLPARILGSSVYWWFYLGGVLNADADARVSRYVRRRGDAIIGRELQGLVADGTVRVLPHRVVSGQGRQVTLEDGTRLMPGTVLWCTGFRPEFSWLDVPGALDADGAPVHDRGASRVPGLHWMGQPWQTRLNSSILDGVDRDARALVDLLRRSRGSGGAGPGDRETSPAATAFAATGWPRPDRAGPCRRNLDMTPDDASGQVPSKPTTQQAREARRRAHEAEKKHRKSNDGGKMGKMGKGNR